MSTLRYGLTAFVLTLASAVPAMAGLLEVPITVPEPTTLSLLSGGAALAILGARWLRRK